MSITQLIAVVLVIFSFSTEAQIFFGGASSFKQFASDIVSGYNAQYGTKLPPYDASGSANGVRGFLNGTYSIGASDAPLNAAEDGKANNLGPAGRKGKYTIPICLSTFTFASRKPGMIKITAAQVAAIYRGQLLNWNVINPKATGTIVPVARADGSGSTNIINAWLKPTGWTLTGDDSWKGKGLYSKIVYATKSDGVIAALNANQYAFGYVITGLAFAAKLTRAYVKNPSGNYVLATDANPADSIPLPLPASDKSWSGVSLVNKIGAKTYPIVSFEYTFAKKAGGAQVKRFLTFSQSSGIQNLLNTKYDNQFFPLPSKVVFQNLGAIKNIV